MIGTSLTKTGAQLEIFQSKGGFAELGHFGKDIFKTTRQKGSAGKNLGVFSPRYYILNGKFKNLTQRWTQSGPFFQDQGTFFNFQKRGPDSSTSDGGMGGGEGVTSSTPIKGYGL